MNAPVIQSKQTRKKFDKTLKQRDAEPLEAGNAARRRENDSRFSDFPLISV